MTYAVKKLAGPRPRRCPVAKARKRRLRITAQGGGAMPEIQRNPRGAAGAAGARHRRRRAQAVGACWHDACVVGPLRSGGACGRESVESRSFHDGRGQTTSCDRSVTGMIRVALDRLYLFSGYLAGAFLVAIFVLMMVLSAGRPLGLNIPAGDDFVSWCMAAMAFLGLAHTFRSRRDDPRRAADRPAAGAQPALDRDRLRSSSASASSASSPGYAVPDDLQLLALPRDVAGRDRDPDVDSADRLCRRAWSSC